MASTHAPSNVQIPRWLVYVVVATFVLIAGIVAGTTIKERITDPAIDGAAESVEQVGEGIASISAAAQAEADAGDRIAQEFSHDFQLDPSFVTVRPISIDEFLEKLPDESGALVPWDETAGPEVYTFSVLAASRPYIVATWRYGAEDEWKTLPCYVGE